MVDVESGRVTQNIVCHDFPWAKLMPFRKNIGYTKAVNAGLAEAKGQHVFIMNPDIIPLKGSIDSMAKHMAKHPDIGLVGPQLLNFDGSAQKSCFRFYNPLTILYRRTILGRLPFAKKPLSYFTMADKKLTRPTTVDWLMGSALIVSKEAYKKVGLMDEYFFLYMSDVDWPRRFWDKGYKVVYYPQAKMYHYHHRQSKGKLDILDIFFNRLTRLHIADALRYFKKYGMMTPNYGN